MSHCKCQKCRRKIAFRKRIALYGGVSATLTPIALHCATKDLAACYGIGNGPRTKNGREMAGEVTGPPAPDTGGSRNGRKMAGPMVRWAEVWRFSGHPAIFPAMFRPFWDVPCQWPPVTWPAISRPFWFWARFPFCSRPANPQVEVLTRVTILATSYRSAKAPGKKSAEDVLSKALFFGTFLAWRFSTSVAGRQQCKTRGRKLLPNL